MSLPRSDCDLQILAKISAMHAELIELRDSHENLARRILDSDDRRTGTSLIPALGAIFHGQRFTVADIATKALANTLHGQSLRSLIGDRLGADGGLKSLGRLLTRIENVRFRDHRLVRDGNHRGGCVWRVSVPSKAALR